ncbi:hypothetical protein PsorP6_003145 [Peronosclerospora sorghi]|uniref:Uncharacterized protein n=1 Tax=Peronosclerospora sorghi TaxID=230839 RepID=A0ACC0VKF8_9STRA|nr:hypothetical protein PsorP6_003145 [Peronosclerospora sorghi]
MKVALTDATSPDRDFFPPNLITDAVRLCVQADVMLQTLCDLVRSIQGTCQELREREVARGWPHE